MTLRVVVYAFKRRSLMVESERLHPVDNHLMRTKHVEMAYDVLTKIGELELDELRLLGLGEAVERLERYGETLVRREEAGELLQRLGYASPEPPLYLVLRLARTR